MAAAINTETASPSLDGSMVPSQLHETVVSRKHRVTRGFSYRRILLLMIFGKFLCLAGVPRTNQNDACGLDRWAQTALAFQVINAHVTA